jgi:hypothetical protein
MTLASLFFVAPGLRSIVRFSRSTWRPRTFPNGDFCDYLRRKESIDEQKMATMFGGEENLLANYLELGHNFSWMDNYDNIVVDDTVWSKFMSLPQVQARRKLIASVTAGTASSTAPTMELRHATNWSHAS